MKLALANLDALAKVSRAAVLSLGLDDADTARRYAAAILGADPDARRQFGNDDAARDRLAAVLRVDLAGVPPGR